MSTSVTNAVTKRTKKTSLTYLSLTCFLFVFSRIYESMSYGEVSFFMHYLFAIPLIGGILLLLALTLAPRLSRISFNLWNSGIATLTTGFLLRGIVNLSGRSTTIDQPYWYIGGGLLLLAILSSLLPTSQQSTQNTPN